MEAEITGKTLIGNIVEKYPHLVETLLSYGVHCVGCHVSPFESLQDGFASHGMSAEQISSAIEKLNLVNSDFKQKNPVASESAETAAKQTKQPAKQNTEANVEQTEQSAEQKIEQKAEQKISISPSAAEKLKALCQEHKKIALKVMVLPGGCSGYKYGLDLVEAKQEEDLEFEENGVKVFIDKVSLERINGATIDYKDTLQGAGFKIINPVAKSHCGCGDSFN